MTTLPASFGFALSERTHACADGRSLVGPGGRVVRLSAAAADVVARAPLEVGADPVVAQVARLLLDRSLADPWWPGPAPDDEAVTDVTVVVPTRGRASAVAGLLAALPAGVPAVVVDDGSDDPGVLAAVAAEHGAACVRHERNRGPAAARNTGLRSVGTPFVAFVDSDVRPDHGWLGELRRHLDDPLVALVAPRVLGLRPPVGDAGRRSWVERYEHDRSSLDLGAHPAAVRVHGEVSYVPSACVLARVDALGDGFDETMRAGEDVDLVWRLLAAGHGVRYVPSATVRHDHRTRVGPWLVRKAFYGSSAAPLAARHGGAVAPLVLTPWTTVWSVAILAQRRWSWPLAAAAYLGATARAARRLDGDAGATKGAAVLVLEGAVAASWQLAQCLNRHFWPVAALWAATSRRGRRAVLVAAVAEGLADRRRVDASLEVLPYLVTHRLDDLAYGAGLWWGALRARSVRALLPTVRWRSRGRRRRAAAYPNGQLSPGPGPVTIPV